MKNDFLYNDKLEDLFLRYLNDELTKEELNDLEQEIEARPDIKEKFDAYRKAWMLTFVNSQTKYSRSSDAFKRFQSRIISEKLNTATGKLVNLTHPLLKAAAILVFGFLITTTVLYFTREQLSVFPDSSSVTETIVPKGSKTEMILPDGTKVWLNAASKLTYGTDFNKSNRTVYLEGEGYFKVSRNEAKKFIVNTQDLEIKALGTEFNVKAYPEENLIETMLVEGKVVVDAKDSKDQLAISLNPNERLIYQKKSKQMVLVTEPESTKKEEQPVLTQKQSRVKKVEVSFDPRAITSWKEEDWVIDREKLSDLAVKIERKYDVNIEFKDESLKNFKFTGTLKDESLEQVLKVMSVASPMVYKISGKEVIFKEDKDKKKQYKDLYDLTN